MARSFQPPVSTTVNGTTADAEPLPLPSTADPLDLGADTLDPFSPESLRLPDDYGVGLAVKKALLSVSVRKPSREWFIRVNPNPEFQLKTHLIELKEEGESYLVSPHLWPDLAGEATFAPRLLMLAVTRQATPFLWPLRLPDAGGRLDSWSRSSLEAAQMAMRQWVRVVANRAASAYDVYFSDHAADPVWPQLTMTELLKLAFKDFYIDSPSHPILQQLRGEG